MLTDIVDGRLLLDDLDIPLAAPVRSRLIAWLDHRNRTWPGKMGADMITNKNLTYGVAALVAAGIALWAGVPAYFLLVLIR